MRVALLACLALSACAHTLPAVPGQGGPAWYEVVGPHFTVFTDLESDQALATLQQLEDLLTAYLTVGWGARGFPERFSVVVFNDPEDVQEFNPWARGFYLSNALLQPLAVAPAHQGDETFAVLKHELNHHIAFAAMPQQPRWFAEGIATFFETASFDDQGRFVLGRVPRTMHLAASWLGVEPVKWLFEDYDVSAARFYSSSWLLVHYLMMRRGDAFAAYQQGLASGASPEEAWSRSFPTLSPDRLDRELAHYLEVGAYENYAARVELHPVAARVRALSDADVYALRGLLYLAGQEHVEWLKRGRANVELALQRDPQHLQAGALRVLYLSHDFKEQLKVAQQLTRVQSEEWLAWLMLAWSEELAGSEQTPSSVDRLLALAPDLPLALAVAAHRAQRHGQQDQAMSLSARAFGKAPFNPVVLAVRAMVLVSSGDAAAGCALIRRALGVLHIGRDPGVQAALARCDAKR